MAVATAPAIDLAVVLVRTEGPINLGLCARVCRNLGVAALRLVAPECPIDCDDSRRFANHAIGFLRACPVHADLAAAVADRELVVGTTARPRHYDHGQPLAPADLPALITARRALRVALVFGNETHGLSTEELRHCHACLRLPTPGDYPSYNLSHAVAIATFQAVGAAAAPPPATRAAAPLDQAGRERLFDYWLGTLDRFGYFRRTNRDRFAPKLRRLLQDLHLQHRDAELLYGMFAQFHRRCFGDNGRPPPVDDP
jgi:tRNA/rRNA methyltransferase